MSSWDQEDKKITENGRANSWHPLWCDVVVSLLPIMSLPVLNTVDVPAILGLSIVTRSVAPAATSRHAG